MEELVWFWFYYALWLASVFTLVLVLRQSSENRSKYQQYVQSIHRNQGIHVASLILNADGYDRDLDSRQNFFFLLNLVFHREDIMFYKTPICKISKELRTVLNVVLLPC